MQPDPPSNPSSPGGGDDPGPAASAVVSAHSSDWHSLVAQARLPVSRRGSPPRDLDPVGPPSGDRAGGGRGKERGKGKGKKRKGIKRGGGGQATPTSSSRPSFPKITAAVDAEPPSPPPQDGSAPIPDQQPPTQPRPRRRSDARNPIVAPSPASGGVPEPSSAYLLRASFLPQTASEPRPILVVIDLNGTLLHRPNRRESSRFIARPHATAFLQYCIATFHVVIWSSARARNVAAMCDALLTPDMRDRVVAFWGRDRFGLCPDDYDRRVQCYKRLTRLWADPAVAAAHPNARHGSVWDQGNTALIDDSAEKARSEPFNAIRIPEFSGNADDTSPSVLPQVHDYLNTLARQVDISMYIRAHPFEAQ